jgi:lysophospholipase L1-like esterase
MERKQQISLMVLIMVLAVTGLFRYVPCIYETMNYCGEPLGKCAEASESRVVKAAGRNVPASEIVRASGTQRLSVSNQVTVPSGKAPVILSHFDKERPATMKPFLRWEKAEDAVAYEIQLARDGVIFQSENHIYINGYNVVLPDAYPGNYFEWRVRALNLDRQPLTPFSQWEKVYVTRKIPALQRPVPTNRFNEGIGTTLLYPVYNWIPVNGAATYEIEILNARPPHANAKAPDSMVIGRGTSTGFDWYDDDKRVHHGLMYWRVRGIDANGRPVGIFCPPQPMKTDPDDHWEVATLGDSIYHGGGNLSYSPSDWEYSFQHFLKFDSINLAQSGDTSEATLARFDEDVVPFHPKYLIIMTGTNSLRGGADPKDVIQDLKALREKCEENGIHPIFMTLPPVNPTNIKRAFDEPTVSDWMQRFAEVNDFIRTQVHIDLGKKIPENQVLSTYLGLDGIHLDTPGKKLMAEAVNEQWDAVTAQFE